MDIDEIRNLNPPSNNENEKTKIQRVTQGVRNNKKDSVLSWMCSHFIAMKPKDVATHVLDDVVAPGVLRFLSDIIDHAKNLLFFGDGEVSSGYTAYGSKSKSQTPAPPSKEDKMKGNFTNVEIKNRDDAVAVKNNILDHLSKYGVVPVSVFYDLVGLESDHTDYNYGWKTFPDGITIVPLTNGNYRLKMPKAVPIDR